MCWSLLGIKGLGKSLKGLFEIFHLLEVSKLCWKHWTGALDPCNFVALHLRASFLVVHGKSIAMYKLIYKRS